MGARMTKAEARKMARLEAENKLLREQQQLYAAVNIPLVREVTAYKIAVAGIKELIVEAEEFAR